MASATDTTSTLPSTPTLALALDPETIEQLADAVAARLADRLPASSQTEDDDGYMSTHSAARYLDLTPNAIHRLASEDRIPCTRPSGTRKLRFRRSSLDRWMLEEERKPRS